VMLYLCNDIVQNSRKESPVFVQEFGKYLAEALRLFYSDPVHFRFVKLIFDFFL
jgi:hypothetical protein